MTVALMALSTGPITHVHGTRTYVCTLFPVSDVRTYIVDHVMKEGLTCIYNS